MSQRAIEPSPSLEATSLFEDPALSRVLADEARRVLDRPSLVIPNVLGLRLRGVGRRPGRLCPRSAS